MAGLTAAGTTRRGGGAGPVARGSVSSPVGTLSLTCGPAGLVRVGFGAGPPRGRPSPDRQAAAVLAGCVRQLQEYFAGRRRRFGIPLDWSGLSPVQHQVLSALYASVGFGETITYGSLGRLAGLGGASMPAPARVVGQIMAANPCPVIVPCHRVVAGDGLGGYSGGTGTEVKRWLLIFEGAEPPTLDWDRSGLAGAR